MKNIVNRCCFRRCFRCSDGRDACSGHRPSAHHRAPDWIRQADRLLLLPRRHSVRHDVDRRSHQRLYLVLRREQARVSLSRQAAARPPAAGWQDQVAGELATAQVGQRRQEQECQPTLHLKIQDDGCCTQDYRKDDDQAYCDTGTATRELTNFPQF